MENTTKIKEREMSDFILVEDGKAIGYPRPLPKSWNNISNFHLVDNDRARLNGWYPVRFVPAEKGENDIVTGQLFVVEGNEVIQYEQIRPMTEEEISQREQQRWESIRSERNGLLKQSDWTVLSDAPLTSEAKQSWINYRSELRNILQTFANPEDVVWPTPPSQA